MNKPRAFVLSAIMAVGLASQAHAACATNDVACLVRSSSLGISSGIVTPASVRFGNASGSVTPVTSPIASSNLSRFAMQIGAALGPQGTARLQATLGVLTNSPLLAQNPFLRSIVSTFSQNL